MSAGSGDARPLDTADATACPGCGLELPRREGLVYDGYYQTSPDCWAVYTEVLAAEYGDAVLFGAVHQLTVDSYAVQHAGGPHPDKSVFVHLAGLHFALDQGVASPRIPPLLQRLAARTETYPHYDPPRVDWELTVCDVALADDAAAHAEAVRAWARCAWDGWRAHHDAVRDAVARTLGDG